MAIYQVYAGGRKDATNVFEGPAVCGFTTIGLDHEDLLGPIIKYIAWQKSGIMKRGKPVILVVQEDHDAKDILEREAAHLDCPLQVVGIHGGLFEHSKLRLVAQKMNASLAICLANAYLSRDQVELSPEDIRVGIDQCNWPGAIPFDGERS